MEPWWLSTAPEGFRGTLSVGMPLFPADGDLATAAAGGYNTQWTAFAKLLASKYPDAIVRPGWEFNIPNWPWSANDANVKDWIAAYRNAAQSMKAAAPGLRMDWNPNGGPGQTIKPATKAYPGDDVVDFVGVDNYDWDPGVTDEASWQTHLTQDGGLQFWADFAREHGKKLSCPEWGVVTANDKNSGGDNKFYVAKMLAFMAGAADIMGYDAYFEEDQDYLKSSLSKDAPAAGQQYAAESAQIRAQAATGQLQPGTDPGTDPGTATTPPSPSASTSASTSPTAIPSSSAAPTPTSTSVPLPPDPTPTAAPAPAGSPARENTQNGQDGAQVAPDAADPDVAQQPGTEQTPPTDTDTDTQH